jgi:hypothetical protein
MSDGLRQGVLQKGQAFSSERQRRDGVVSTQQSPPRVSFAASPNHPRDFLQARNQNALLCMRLCGARLITRFSRGIHSTAFGGSEKIILQIPAMTPGLFQKEEWKIP